MIDKTLVFASLNENKVRELTGLLNGWKSPEWKIVNQAQWGTELEDTLEDQNTFQGNALKKAVEISLATGCVSIADDSGLSVDALQGAPGVYSARYSGDHRNEADNNALLISNMEGKSNRSAHFVTVIAMALPNNEVAKNLLARKGLTFDEISQESSGEEKVFARHDDVVTIWFRGQLTGTILDTPRGSHGFAYDPYFLVDGLDKTLAELTTEEKITISHRTKAIQKMIAFFD